MNDDQAGRLIASVRRYSACARWTSPAGGRRPEGRVAPGSGKLERVSVARFRRVCSALGIEPVWIFVGGEGWATDSSIAITLGLSKPSLPGYRLGWEPLPEYTFNVYGERGSVDILAWHPLRRALLVIEVKTRLTDLQQLLMSMSRKVRLVPALVAEERGWVRLALGHLVVMLDTRSNRLTVGRHEGTFAATFPSRTAAVRAWLRSPVGDLAGLWFLALRREAHPEDRLSQRVKRSPARTGGNASVPEAPGSSAPERLTGLRR